MSSSGPICPHPAPKSPPTPQPARPNGVSNGCGPPRLGGATPRTKERGTAAVPQLSTLLADAALRRGWGDTQDRVGEAGPGQPRPASNTHRNTDGGCLPEAQETDQFGRGRSVAHARAPVLSPNQRPLRHHAQCALFLSSRHAHPHNLLSTLASNTAQSAKAPPLQRNPAPRRPSGPYVPARGCVPASALSPARSLPSSALSPHSSRCRWRARGREQRRAASPPPLRPGPGSFPPPPRSLRPPPPSGTGRSKPLPGARGTSWPQPPRVPMESPNLYPVKLYVYDLSKGLARRLSPIMLGEGAGRGREGKPEPSERVRGRPAEVGRPGPRAAQGGDVGPRDGEKPP